MKSYLFVPLIPLLLTGCIFVKQPTPELHQVKLEKKVEFNDLEKEILDVAKDVQRQYTEYSQILMEVQDRHRSYTKSKIPKRMARRVTFVYDGPALKLLKIIAEETQYHLDMSKTRWRDSKNISRKYENTLLIDILYDLVDSQSMVVQIDEKDEIIRIMDK